MNDVSEIALALFIEKVPPGADPNSSGTPEFIRRCFRLAQVFVAAREQYEADSESYLNPPKVAKPHRPTAAALARQSSVEQIGDR